MAAVVSSVDRPVNVVMGLQGVQLNLAQLSALGVSRVNVGSALYRTAVGAFMRAAQEMQGSGSFSLEAARRPPARAKQNYAIEGQRKTGSLVLRLRRANNRSRRRVTRC